MSSFSLGDFVTIERPNEEKPLIGTVAYLGPVHFAEGDDWVGIKLSGSSVGLGKNDGSVKGKRYFEDCGERGGAFVRKSVLKKRMPSKLEELRLRKEKRESSRRLSTSTPSSATTATTTTRASRRSLDGKIGGSPSSSANVSVSSNSADKKSVPSKATSTSPRIVDTNTAKTRSKASVSPPKPSVTNNSEISQAQESKLEAAKAESNKAKEKIMTLEKEHQNLAKEKDTLSDKYQSLEQNHSSLMEKYEALQSKYISSQNSKEDSADSGSGEIIEELNGELRSKESELEKYKSENQELNEQIVMKENNLQNQIDSLEAQLLQSNTKVSQLTQELSTMNAQSASRGQSEQSYLKEKTKFQSENISLKRRVKELEESTLDLEAAIEDLTLDKEQLAEEKEQMEDTLQEKLLDIEGVNLELEDVKLQLEEAHVQIEEMKLSFSQNDGDEANAVGEANSDNAEEMVQTLSTQNGRLREALVRLREQSNIEKMELAKQVRTLEKESSALKETAMKAENLSVKTKEYEEQIRELKDMVDENSVMESLMEELSDKNLVLEDANIKLKGNIASLEEAAEIAAEMEELQQEEISTLMQNLEEKESQVLALETAIQLQRKREDDFQKTFQKYKISNERLQQESLMLREKHEDGAGEKSQLLATSQKALAQASIMVQNAANMRKELAKAVFDQIDFRVNKIFSERIQSFLPTQEFVGTEISALRGELLLVKVSSLSSISLKDVNALNLKSMQKAREELSSKPEMLDESKEDSEEIITISDDAAQEISVIIHQAKFAFLANEAGAETLRILCMGQWPNHLNPEKSSELAASIVGPFASLNEALSNNLRIMKEEGTLSPHHANFSNLEDSMKEVKSLDSKEWEPPAWSIFRDVTSAKYACLGAAAIVSCIISPISETGNDAFISPYTPSSPLGLLFAELEQLVSEASKITQRLTAPSQQDTPTPVLEATKKWCESSHKLLNLFENVFRDMEVMEDKIYECHAQVSQVLDDAVKVSALVRAHKMLGEEDGGYHPFSPESDSCWEAVVEIVSDMVNEENSDETGEEKFVNFVLRSQAVEQRLTNALENETKLLVATEQVSSLEKVRYLFYLFSSLSIYHIAYSHQCLFGILPDTCFSHDTNQHAKYKND